MRVVEMSAEPSRGFTNHLKVIDNPDLNEFVLLERVPASGSVAFDPGNGV